MCNQCVTPNHLGIKGFTIVILGSVHTGFGPGRSHTGSSMGMVQRTRTATLLPRNNYMSFFQLF